MESIAAVQKAVSLASKIKDNLRQDLALRIPEEFLTEEFWMDRISPESFFTNQIHLVGFVYSIIIAHVKTENNIKSNKVRTINFNTAHVLDAWTESIIKNDTALNIDYIKLNNGVMITITDKAITIFDANDLEVPDSAVAFRNIVTRDITDDKK